MGGGGGGKGSGRNKYPFHNSSFLTYLMKIATTDTL